MSLETSLYLYRNLNQAPGLALDAIVPYAQSIGYLKTKTAHFLNTCNDQLQNTINVAYPILRHPRSSIISAILLSTKHMANLTGMAFIYKKSCYILSKRADRIAAIENELLSKLKNLSNYCIQLNTSYIPWQKIPELQDLEELKEELLNNQQIELSSEHMEKITEAIFCCDAVHALVTRHHYVNAEDLTLEDVRAIEENTDTVFSAVEENTGETLGSYIPLLLAPTFNDVLNSIPKSYNPLTSVSNSLMTTLKKISVAIGSSSFLTITSSHYFVSSNSQKTLLQLSAITGMSAFGLYYQDHPIMQQTEEAAKEIIQTFLEIIFAYAGMLLFKTDESFKDYFHKIVPATAASKATEYYLAYKESSAIASFVFPFVVSSLVYNQSSILETCQQFKTLSINILNGEAKKQFLQPVASLITNYIINCSSNRLSQIALEKGLDKAIFSSIMPPTSSASQLCSLLESVNRINSSNISILVPSAASYAHPSLGNISNVALNDLKSINSSRLASVASYMNSSKIIKILTKPIHPLSKKAFTSTFLPVINQILAQSIEQQVLQILNIQKEYLTILQQDDMQELLLKIQNKLNELDPEAEELMNQFLKDVFLKKTGRPLHLDKPALDLLKNLSGLDIQAILFTSFKNAPLAIRMLWNSYSYHKKVDQTLILELLLQGLIIIGLANLVIGSDTAELPSFSYLKTVGLGINLAL